MTKSSLLRILKRGEIRRCSNRVKPILTPAHKLKNVQWDMPHIDWRTKKFIDIYLAVHIDEKWFYLKEKCTTFYLSRDEPEPERTGPKHMLKVMSLCAVVRPRFEEYGTCNFNGKLVIWPFTYQKRAQRSSRNRPAGTLETKNLDLMEMFIRSSFSGK